MTGRGSFAISNRGEGIGGEFTGEACIGHRSDKLVWGSLASNSRCWELADHAGE